MLLFLLTLGLLMLIMHVISKIAKVGIFFLSFVLSESLLSTFYLLFLCLRLFFLHLSASSTSLDDHLFATFFVLNELLAELGCLLIPFAHFELSYYKPHLSTVIMETTNRSGLQCY